MMVVVKIVVVVLEIATAYKIAAALRCDNPILYAVAMILPVPFLSLFIIAYLSGKSTTILRKCGVRVGVMGANQEDIERIWAAALHGGRDELTEVPVE